MTFSTRVYGFSIGQYIYYLLHYSEDKRILKVLVASLVLIDTLRNALYLQAIWVDLIQDHAAVLLLLKGFPQASLAAEFFTALIILIVQSYFIWKVWELMGENKYRTRLTYIAVLLTLVTFGSSLAIVYEMSRASVHFSQVNVSWATPVIIALSCCLAVDTYITAVLCFIMRRSRTGVASTENMLSMLVRYNVERGLILLISQVAFTGVLAYGNVKRNEVAAAIFYPAGSLYVNTILAVPAAQLAAYEFVACWVGIMPYFDFTRVISNSDENDHGPTMADTFTATTKGPFMVSVRERE
ncbi:uncharacterized protein LAESUDRAFT_762442 [Laetiporus sulphureus 93-53]|uniref:DUF6534 domain-containing protein n=1 Tax=Laetiporus sulphureus 93-53 TaxID=1314785 RepID=A0A165CH40_9APHY|nr:uncharacterized protein LAESUDRAFT_762442 [Laetiporus sulphureus 93-53]KZT02797.1 hypothetical protein LAESUDRAFT_762442 [Laetiporus sulphureus 93-53]